MLCIVFPLLPSSSVCQMSIRFSKISFHILCALKMSIFPFIRERQLALLKYKCPFPIKPPYSLRLARYTHVQFMIFSVFFCRTKFQISYCKISRLANINTSLLFEVNIHICADNLTDGRL